jgi:hypothetical protein
MKIQFTLKIERTPKPELVYLDLGAAEISQVQTGFRPNDPDDDEVD